MIIGSISENLKLEKRVAITPDIVKKYKSLGLDVNLCKDYALHLGISDKEYINEGERITVNIPFPEINRRIKGILAISKREDVTIALLNEKFN